MAWSRRTLLAGLWVFLGYYLGAKLGFALTFQPHPVSVLWPPNSILVAALLLTPPRRWWFILVAAFPAHWVAQLQSQVPPAMIMSWFVTNCCEGLIGAGLTRYFLRGPMRFTSLRNVSIFCLCVALAGPFFSSFLDAGFVVLNQWGSGGYWEIWRIRLPSNALAALTIAPLIVTWAANGLEALRNAPRRRFLEGVLLSAGLLLVSFFVVYRDLSGANSFLVYLPLPFLLWSAVRFGTCGASTAVATVTFLAIWSAAHGHGPFSNGPAEENALALQMFFIVLSVPLMFLAVVVEVEKRSKDALSKSEAELRAGRAELEDQVRFERLGTDISSTLMSVPPEALGEQVVPALGHMAQLLGFDVATLALFREDGTGVLPYIWQEPGTPELPATLTDKNFPWSVSELLSGRDVHIRTLNDFPPEAEIDRATFEQYGLKSGLEVPLLVNGKTVGVLSIGSFCKELALSPQFVERQRVLGSVFGNALVRARSEVALHESEEGMRLAADAVNLGIWHWDLTKDEIWTTNERRTFLGLPVSGMVTFEDFLSRVHPDDRKHVQQAIDEAIRDRKDYDSEYRFALPNGVVRWMSARGRVHYDASGQPTRFLGISIDITVRKEAELEAKRRRDDLGHLGRVALLGEMSASFAHELNQPLSGIVSNAGAGQRFIERGNPDLQEMHELLGDINADARRAADIVKGIRTMVKKGETSRQRVNLNDLVMNVVQMVGPDALLHSCELHTSLDEDLPAVEADAVQVQQVLLNLIVNAFDAMREMPKPSRKVEITTMHNGSVAVCISVRDHGIGLSQETSARMFEQFFTTKAEGLGMGLAIVRSIAESHDGTITADNADGGGARFQFSLPIKTAA